MNKKEQTKKSKKFSKKWKYEENYPIKVRKEKYKLPHMFLDEKLVTIINKKPKYSMREFLITYWWVVVALDWSSTIVAHDYRVEENPFIKNIWKNYGDLGFTLTAIFFGAIITIAIILNEKYGHKKIIYPFLILMISFKFLISLTNLALVPYAWTAWFQF